MFCGVHFVLLKLNCYLYEFVLVNNCDHVYLAITLSQNCNFVKILKTTNQDLVVGNIC